MKRALIIVSCGLILALIIGATTQTKPSKSVVSSEPIFETKCTEPTPEKPAHIPCALRIEHDSYVDKFLREHKRKNRHAYA